MKKFEEKVEMVVIIVLLLGLGICIGAGIIEMIMFDDMLHLIAIVLFGAITLMALCFWAFITMLPEDDEVEED